MNRFEIIFYVADQEKSRVFYSDLLQKLPSLDVPGMTEFDLSKELKLGLMPETGIAKILSDKTPDPATGNGIPRCELYLVRDDIDAVFERAVSAGAIVVSPIEDRDWGDRVGYVADPDGHILAFASRPQPGPTQYSLTAEAAAVALEAVKARFPEKGENISFWDELPETRKELLQAYFESPDESGFCSYHDNEQNWTLLTTHQLFGKRDGEFCCFRLGEILSFENTTVSGGDSVLEAKTAHENFSFACDNTSGASVMEESLRQLLNT